jgi:dimethylamine monooxygenase subunit A
MSDAAQMAAPFRHRPYDGRATPFTIGLKAIDPARWIEPDERRTRDLAEKRQLIAGARDVVVFAEAGTQHAQGELLAMLRGHLAAHHPGLDTAASPDREPIVTASLLVQDDLVLMRHGPEGWRIAAASLCFPSTWSLAEKTGMPMEAIHAAVPGFAGQMAERVNRIFDRLPDDQIVERLNWSVYSDDRLHHPESKSGPRTWTGLPGGFQAGAFVRVERQTLRRLPVSRDIVFTIRVYVDPVAAFRTHPDGRELAASMARILAGLDPDQLAYKNMVTARDEMLAGLDAIAQG